MLENIISSVVAGVILKWIDRLAGWFGGAALPGPRGGRGKPSLLSSFRAGSVSSQDIRDAVDGVSADSSKEDVVESMVGDLRNRQLTGDELEEILSCFSSDSSKEKALGLLLTKARQPIPGPARTRIIQVFHSSSSQARAARMMGS